MDVSNELHFLKHMNRELIVEKCVVDFERDHVLVMITSKSKSFKSVR